MIFENAILIDTNIVIYTNIDKSVKDKKRLDLKEKAILALTSLPNDSVLFYNLTIYKEVSVGVHDRKEVEHLFNDINSNLILENKEVMYKASEAYRGYLKDFKALKENTEKLIYKSKTIPNDCIIGATAVYYGLTIMTNNGKDFRKYFPNVELIEI